MKTRPGSDPLPWEQSTWMAEVEGWVRESLTDQNLHICGEVIAFHQRPWAVVLRVPTEAGDCYMKASAPALAYEAGLTQALSNWQPDCIPDVLACEPERGWMLLRDGGPTLRSQLNTIEDIRHLQEAYQRYAGLQMQIIGRGHELLVLGAFDRRLETLPVQFEWLLEQEGALMIDQPDGLRSDEVQQLHALHGRFGEMCGRLASFNLPETLHHDDFHDGNIFLQEGRYTFFDWGESCVAHPFFSLVVGLRSAAYRFKLQSDAPEICRLRDAYLQRWEDYDSPENLHEAANLAQIVGTVCRALTWHEIVSALSREAKTEYADAVPGWLGEFLTAVKDEKP